MEEIIECIKCGSKNILPDEFGDIRCVDCMTLLVRNYYVDSKSKLSKDMNTEDAKIEVSKIVYKAACIIEALEHLGLYHGNGHHAAQDIAKYAEERFMKGVMNEEND